MGGLLDERPLPKTMQGDLSFDVAHGAVAACVGPGWQGYEAVAASVLTPENRFMAAALAGRNCFLTGMAGTGKSTLLRRFIEECLHSTNVHRVDVTAPTGVAALNVGGMTIHRFCGMMLGPQPGQSNEEYFNILRRDPRREPGGQDARRTTARRLANSLRMGALGFAVGNDLCVGLAGLENDAQRRRSQTSQLPGRH